MSKPPPPSDGEVWFDILPKPPRPFGEQTEADIAAWMDDCVVAAQAAFDAGNTHDKNALNALEWLWRPDTWPYGPNMRSRLQHIRGALFRRIDTLAAYKREDEANARIQQQRQANLELRRSKGWA